MDKIWQFVMDHQTTATLVGYYLFAAFVGALPMPDEDSTKLYRFFFSFFNTLAANISRVSAVSTAVSKAKPLDLNQPKP